MMTDIQRRILFEQELEQLKTVVRERFEQYGGFHANVERIAQVQEKLGHKGYSPSAVYRTLVATKLGRIGSGTFHRDNFIDAAAYLLWWMIHLEHEQRLTEQNNADENG